MMKKQPTMPYNQQPSAVSILTESGKQMVFQYALDMMQISVFEANQQPNTTSAHMIAFVPMLVKQGMPEDAIAIAGNFEVMLMILQKAANMVQETINDVTAAKNAAQKAAQQDAEIQQTEQPHGC